MFLSKQDAPWGTKLFYQIAHFFRYEKKKIVVYYHYITTFRQNLLQFLCTFIAFFLVEDFGVAFSTFLCYNESMLDFIYNDIDFQHKIDQAGHSSEIFEKHIHPFNELIYFVNGNVEYTVEAESRKLKSGEIIFIPAGKYHFATVDNSSEYERYVLKFPDTFVPQYIKTIRDSHSCFLGNAQEYFNILKEFDEMNNSYTNDELYTLFLCNTIRMLVEIYHSPTRPLQEKAPVVIKFLLDYINDNLDKKITLESLSKVSNFSKSYISNSFKLYMKTPIIQYVRTKKILAAHKMIEEGAKPYQVARELGFDDYSTFYRSYVSIIGSAPANNNSKDTLLHLYNSKDN